MLRAFRSLAVAAPVLAWVSVASADTFRWDPAVMDSTLLAGVQTAAGDLVPAVSPEHRADRVELEPYALVAADFHGVTIAGGGAGIHWFVAEQVSAGFFGEVLHVNQADDNAVGLGGGVLLRWHAVQLERCSLFAEVGVGVIGFDNPVPAEATSVAFSPRAAAGAQFALDAGTHCSVRVGWLHFSNAQTGEENPGIDALSFAVGLHIEF
jgi:hypothetical protein